MKTDCLAVLLIVSILAGFSSVAAAAGQDFTIINASDYDIYDLAITPAGSDARGPNALKGELLSGRRVRIVFPNYDSGISEWDVWGSSCCGETLKWRQLNLHAAHLISLRDGGLAELN